MVVEDLEKDLNSKKLQTLYLFYGEELFLLENCVKKIKTLFGEIVKGINYVVLDETNIKNLISEIETPAFGYEKKLIICKNSGLLKKEGKKKNTELSDFKEKLNDYIQKNIKTMQESVVLVIIEEDVQKQELVTTIEKTIK